MINNLYWVIDEQIVISGDTRRMFWSWLKSLKGRYTWKPSDEQIRALHDLNLIGNLSYVGQRQALIGLYNDLKKLKAEE